VAVFRREGGSPEPLPYNAIRPITASGYVVKATDKSEIEALKQRKASQKWQQEAWEYVDAIGEINYAFNLFSNVVSRIRIHAAYITDDQDTPTPVRTSEAPDDIKEHASEAMHKVFGSGKQGEILRKTAFDLLVAGECWLVNEKTMVNGLQRDNWKVVSTDELVPFKKGFALKSRREQSEATLKQLPADTFMGRVFRSHPRYSDEPDSSMRALCDLCNELLLLSRSVRATARSRLNAGALLLPDELGLSADITTDEVTEEGLEPYVEETREEFEDTLVDHMVTPIADEGSAAAVAPLIIRGPLEALKEVRLIKFERSFDPQLSIQRDRALDRILQGLELPKEIVTGLSNVKYSNAIQINESLYTAHVEPLVLLLCDVFRTVYLEPYLIREGCDPAEVEKTVIWYDPSGITTAPDKSTAANVGFDKKALSAKAWRQANGFNEEDAPSDLEKVFRLAFERGPVTPEFMDTVLRQLVPELLAQTRANTLANQGAPMPGSVSELIGTETAPPADPGAATGAPPELAEPDAAPTGEAPATPEDLPPTDTPAAEGEAPTDNGDFTDGFTTDPDDA
jgi:hypothetical protein